MDTQLPNTQFPNTQLPNDVITHAPHAERQAILGEYLDWLTAPASQARQCYEELYRPETGQCCALGGLGDLLVQRGYARWSGTTIEVFLQGECGGGPLRTSVSSYKLPIDALAALGLERHQGEIMRMNDIWRVSFAAIAARLRQYAQWFHPERHHLSSGPLCPEEQLLVMALERNKFTVTAERGQTTWSGDTECVYHLRAGATVLFAARRLAVLTGLWGVVSGQRGWQVHVHEHHLRGSVVQADIRSLKVELRAQEAAEDTS